MKQIDVLPVSIKHVDELCSNMRKADVDEVQAGTSLPLKDVVIESVEKSALSCTVLLDGEVACILGVVPVSLLGSHGIPWMLGTTLVDKNVRTTLRAVKPLEDEISNTFKKLENFVDARNKKAIRLIKARGFTVHAPKPYGPYGMPFHRFTRGF